MDETFNVYCDESCQLEHDRQRAMVLGALWCPAARSHAIATELRAIKRRHGLAGDFEVKWTKVSPGGKALYLDLIEYFFAEPDLHFRALVVPDKMLLRQEALNQTHDTWYYTMYSKLLSVIMGGGGRYRIYLDVKDTRSAPKVKKLHEVLNTTIHDFDRENVERLQAARSYEVEQIQLADLLTGCVSYANRNDGTSAAKWALVRHMEERTGRPLTRPTARSERKVNLFHWTATAAS